MSLSLRLGNWLLVLVAGLLIPAAAILSVWLPVLSKYSIVHWTPSPSEIAQLKMEPDDLVLDEIGRQSLAVNMRLDEPLKLRTAAEGIIRGELLLPGYPPVALSKPFQLQDLDHYGETLGLHLGSLVDVRILLDAYAQEAREDYLATAVERYSAFVRAEREAWLPHGFLWNDHAIAARIGLSARLWRLTRKHPDYGPALEVELPMHIWRSIKLLADPAQFTYATNHGVMQNVALLQAAAAFPAIPDARDFAALAKDRLDEQLGHYLSREGVVLEHSAGYHKHGVELLTIAIRAAELAGIRPSPEWIGRVTKARSVLETMRRPDGSLPRLGNTHGDPDPVHDFTSLNVKPPQDGLSVLPLSGYAFWRDSGTTPCNSKGTHLSFAASLFPGHGHKLADEGSLILWAGGRPWLDNTGYWPFGYAGRTDVDGWRGSNAPHLVNEPSNVSRVPVLTHAMEQSGLLFLAFVREGADGSRVQRQVLGIDSGTWLVVDFADGSRSQPLESLWTFAPDLLVRTNENSPNGYEIGNAGLHCAMDFRLAENDVSVTRLLQGQMSPFGGWMMQKGIPAPATAIELSSGSQRSAVLLSLRGEGDPRPVLDQWTAESDQQWHARLTLTNQGRFDIVRSGATIRVMNNHEQRDLLLSLLPPLHEDRAAIAESLKRLAERYPPLRDYLPWRIKASKALLSLAAVSLFALVVTAWRVPRKMRFVCIADMIGWITVTLWMHMIYFA